MGEVLTGVSAIAGGYGHTIALKNGEVLAWGWNYLGKCNIPTAAKYDVIAISGGGLHTIALKGFPSSITGVLPVSGSSIGGTPVQINGNNFSSSPTVKFGGVAATGVEWVSPSLIRAVTPAGLPGMTSVSVNGVSAEAFYYRPSCGSDLDNNGVVDSADLGIILLDFGNCYESAANAPQEPMIFPIEAAKPVAVKK